ncbi:MAG: class I SAM-dependent rRNA methyltransferase [Gemmatimonadaceae bacterium]
MLRPEAIVSKRGAARWAVGHPWIFKSDLVGFPDAPAGAVRVLDQRKQPLGVALWSPTSEIALRLLDRDPAAALDAAWWDARIGESIARRAGIAEQATAYRLIHGEGDALPSLVCDRYGDYLVVQLLSAGLEAFRAAVVASLVRHTGSRGILARNDAPVRQREGLSRETTLLTGDVPQTIEAQEHGIRFVAAPWTGQKTGAFLDQRENRALTGTLARGRGTALDCFSYHGSFALHMARGAQHVTALDSSASALVRAAANAQLNDLDNIAFVEANAFDYLREQEDAAARFDLIVLDPPAFAKSRASVPKALGGYNEINRRAMRLLARGGVLFTASCSYHVSKGLFLDMLQQAAQDSGRRVALRRIVAQPVDHPEILSIPESGYIKGAVLEALE